MRLALRVLLLLVVGILPAHAETQLQCNAILPADGNLGTRVTIRGHNLLGIFGTFIQQVTLAGEEAEVVQGNDPDEIIVIAPNGFGVGDVVITADTGSQAISTNAWQFRNPGVISSVTPASGQVGTLVQLRGLDLLSGGTAADTVILAGVEASVQSANATLVVVRARASNNSISGPIYIVSNTGAIVTSDLNWTYVPQSSIESVTPSQGQAGTRVTVRGSTLRGQGSTITQVLLAGVDVANIVSESDSEVVVVAAPNAVGAIGDIVLVADSGAITTATNAWEYLTPGSISAVQPTSGQLGTEVAIRGEHLLGGGAVIEIVRLVGRLVEHIISYNDSIVVVSASAGPNTEELGDVLLVANTGAWTQGIAAWRYVPPGFIQSVRPSSGLLGTQVQVIGINLCGGGTRVVSATLAGHPAILQAGNDCGVVNMRAQDYGVNITGDVVLISDTGARVILPNSWTYIAAGIITQVTPSAGQADTLVTVQGDNLYAGGTAITSASLAGVAGLVVSHSSTQVVIRCFAGTGRGDVVLLSDTGVTVRYVDGWTYSQITSLTPGSGQRGTHVRIAGVALLAGGHNVTTVRLARIAVQTILSASSDVVEVVAPRQAVDEDLVGDVELVMDNGQTVVGINLWTYKIPGTMSAVTPGSGQHGTRITIRGQNLLGHGNRLASATLAGIEAREISFANNTYVELVAGHSDVTLSGTIVLTADTGARVLLSDGTAQNSLVDGLWHYVQPPVITSVSPQIGQLGSRVTIEGTGLLGGGQTIVFVSLAGVVSDEVSEGTDTKIVVTAKANGPTALGNVTVTANTGAFGVMIEAWQYADAGVIATVAPASGQQGTRVEISGSGLRGSGAAVASVMLAGVAAAIQFENDTLVVVHAGTSNTEMTGDVVIVADSGAIHTKLGGWTYVPPGNVTALTPNRGQVGTLVSITGTNLLGGGDTITSVEFDGTEVLEIVSSSDTLVFVVAPRGLNGTVSVRLVANTGAITLRDSAFEYLAEGTVNSVTPSSGQYGTRVQVQGQNLLGGGDAIVNVTFGGLYGAVTGSSSNEMVEAVAPAGGEPGVVVDVVLISNTGATVTQSAAWTWLQAGLIDSVSPDFGHFGTLVNISGQRLLAGGTDTASVLLAGVPVAAIHQGSSDTFIQVVAGAGNLTAGPVVVISDTGAIITFNGTFRYINPGVVVALSPSAGQRGTRVDISGSGLLGGGHLVTLVALAGVPVAEVISATDTLISVIAARGAASIGNVTIVSDTGATVVSDPFWTYLEEGRVTDVSPATGIHHTLVVISGQGLLGGGAAIVNASLAGIPVEAIVSFNDSQVMVFAGVADGPIVGDVELLADTGARVSQGNVWEYQSAGLISGVVPSFGQNATVVTITGDRLLGDGNELVAVWLAGVRVAHILEFSNTVVRVVANATTVAQVGHVVLETNTGGRVTALDAWEYRTAGEIVSFAPTSGTTGTQIIIFGFNLRGHASAVADVTVVGSLATLLSEADFLISVRAGPSNASSGLITLTSTSGSTITSATEFTYLAPAIITGIAPNYGQVDTVATITGENLLGGGSNVASVLLGSTFARVLSGNDSFIIIQAQLASPDLEPVDVRITADTGATVVFDRGWQYMRMGDIDNVSPSSGQFGTRVTISGQSLLGAGDWLVTVTLATVPAVIVAQSNTQVVVIAQASSAFTGDVVLISNTQSTVVQENGFSYVTPAQILMVTPSIGHEGTLVTIQGSGLLGGAPEMATVSLAGAWVTDIRTANDTVVVVVAGPSNITAPADVVLIAATGATTILSEAFAYGSPGNVELVSPAQGQRGTVVAINGSGLRAQGTGVTQVFLAGEEAEIIWESDTSVMVRAPASGAKIGDVLLWAESGGFVRSAPNVWTFTEAGNITAVTPSSGQLNTRVTISGDRLLGGGTAAFLVKLGGATATVLSSSATEVVVVAPDGNPGLGDVSIESDTGALVDAADVWQYLENGTITSFFPSAGQLGARVTLQGMQLFGGAENVVSVTLAGVPVASIVAANNTWILVEAGFSSEAVSGDIVITSSSGSTVSAHGWRYTLPGDIITVTPNSGQAGTLVSLAGNGLRGSSPRVALVLLNGVEADILFENDTLVVVAAGPSDESGYSNVSVVGLYGAWLEAAFQWRYLSPGNITAVSPGSGREGTVVTVTGDHLLGGGTQLISVTLSGVPVRHIVNFSATQVVVVVGNGSAATSQDVVLLSDTGARVFLSDGWQYLAPGIVNSVAPSSGQWGHRVTISGEGLLGGGTSIVSVTLDGTEVESITAGNDTIITLVAAAASPGVPGSVLVTANTGAVVEALEAWQYVNASGIDNVSPSSGQEGTLVTIVGFSLFGTSGTGVTAVMLAGVEAQIQSASPYQLVVRATDAFEGPGDVIVTAVSGARAVLPDGWTPLPPGAINGSSPSSGQVGTRVSITGQHLLGGGTSIVFVSLNNVTVHEIVHWSDNLVVVVAAAGAAGGSGDIVLVADTGALTVGRNLWTYANASAILDSQPRFGQQGTTVVITGVHLRGHGQQVVEVTLAGETATVLLETDEAVTVRAAPFAGTKSGDVVLRADNGATAVFPSAWEYLAAANITDIVPSMGREGTRVTITGIHLLGYGQSLESVQLAGVPVASIVEANDTYIEVVAGRGPTGGGSGSVEIVGDSGGYVERSNAWMYLGSGEITSVQPSSGQQGTRVIVFGSNICGGGSRVVGLILAGVPAILDEEQSSCDGLVIAVMSYHNVSANTVGDVVVTSDTGALVRRVNGWTTLVPGQMESVVPSAGVSQTKINITGTNMLGGGSSAFRVTLNGVAASIISSSPSLVVVVANPGSGVGDVVIESNTGARVTLEHAWTYSIVSSSLPSEGQPGTRVTLTGKGLLGGGDSVRLVTVCGTTAPEILLATASSVVFVVPLISSVNPPVFCDVVLRSGPADVMIVHVQGLLYRVPGVISVVDPSTGHDGTQLLIEGTNLLGGGSTLTQVYLANKPVTSILAESNTQVRVVAAGSNQTVGDVQLVADTGAIVTLSDGWSYIEQAIIDRLEAPFGRQGTITHILGSGLLLDSDILSVTLAAVPARIIALTATNITVEANASTPQQGDVVVTSRTGAFVRKVNAFSFGEPGVIEQVDPAMGYGGFIVTVRGQHLLGGGSSIVRVTLASIPVTQVISSNDTVVVVKVAVPSDPFQVRLGDVVLTADTGATVTKVAGWRYNIAGNITQVTPHYGRVGTRVVIEGTDLLGTGSTVLYLQLAGYAVRQVTLATETRLEAVAGPGDEVADGSVEILSDSGSSVVLESAWSYVANGTVTSILPASGQVGTEIVLYGSAMLGGGASIVEVLVGNTSVREIISSNDTTVVVVLADTAASGPVELKLLADTGAELISQLTLLVPGVITAISPSEGQKGTLVTVSGVRLLGGGSSLRAAFLGEVASTVLSANDTHVVLKAGSSTDFGTNVTVSLIADTGAEVTRAAAWRYLHAGVLQSAQPSYGHFSTRVTISGERLRGGGAHVVSVMLAGVPVESILTESDTEVVTAAGPSVAQQGEIVLQADSGAVVSGLLFQYREPGAIFSIDPTSGQFGSLLTITGQHLLGHGTSLEAAMLGIARAEIKFANDTVVILSAGSTYAGLTNVTLVSNTGAIVHNASGWRYLEEGVVTGVSPTQGRVGTVVTLQGERLRGGGTRVIAVFIGDVAAAIVAENDTTVVVVIDDNEPGIGDVVIESDLGARVTATSAFTYLGFVVEKIEPLTGVEGTTVRIHGRGLLSGHLGLAAVYIAGQLATFVPPIMDIFVSFRAGPGPLGAPLSGPIILVSNQGAIINAPYNFTYLAAGNITAVTPSSGQLGTLVTLTGHGLFGGGTSLISVLLASVPARIVEASNTKVVAEASSSLARSGDVLLEANTGALTRAVSAWTYLAGGRVTAVIPGSGQFGTLVTIGGLQLRASGQRVTSVQLNDLEVEAIISESDRQVIVRAPDGFAGTGDVRLLADTGGLVVASEEWTFLERGAIDSVSPPSGMKGTYVTVRGERLLGGGATIVAANLINITAEVVSSNDTQVILQANWALASDPGAVVLFSDSGAVVQIEDGWRYITPGLITQTSPNFGQGGTRVWIEGNGLRGGGTRVMAVWLHGALALVVAENDTHVEVVAGSVFDVGLGTVVVRADTGAEVIAVDAWTAMEEGVIEALTPAEGQFGTIITISGTNLRGSGAAVVAVTLGGTSVLEIVAENNTAVVVVANVSNAAVNTSVVLTADTGAVVQLEAAWTYLAQGVIESVSPSSGQADTRVEITGQRLLGGGKAVISVYLAETAVTAVLLATDTVLIVVAAHANAGQGDVTIVSDTGAIVVAQGAWSYFKRGQILSVSPSTGQLGSFVQINGSGLLGGGLTLVNVTLSGVAAVPISVDDDSSILVRANAGPPGPGDIVLTADTGATVEVSDGFTFAELAYVTSVFPSNGRLGTLVSIRGSGLLGGGFEISFVSLAAQTADEILFSNDTLVVVRAAAGPHNQSGPVVLFSDTGATSVLPNAFTYLEPGVITAISPGEGQRDTRVTLTGAGFLGGGYQIAQVLLANVEARIVFANDTMIIVAAGVASEGSGPIVVVANTGAVLFADEYFNYLPAGEVSLVLPSSGHGGTMLKLYGTNLLSGGTAIVQVTLAGVVAEVVNFNATTVELIARPGAAQVGDVVITVDTGATVHKLQGWLYVPAGLVTAVAPGSGQQGTYVEISGSGLRGGGGAIVSVALGNVAVAVILAENDTHVQVVASGCNQSLQGDVVLTADSGATVTAPDNWTCTEAIRIEAVEPIEGTLGTRVTLYGQHLLQGDQSVLHVTLAGIPVSSIDASNNTHLVVTAADGSNVSGSIRVTLSSGAYGEFGSWFYLPRGVVYDLLPASGQEGTRVSIRGDGLLGGGQRLVRAWLGSIQAEIGPHNDTHVVLIAAPGLPANSGDVLLEADSGAETRAVDGWTYTAPGEILAVFPSSGQMGTNVVVSGIRLLGAGTHIVRAFLGGIEADVGISSNFQVQLKARASVNASGLGPVLLVANTGAVVHLSEGWAYLVPGAIAAVTPGAGAAGTEILIVGSNLFGGGLHLVSARLAGVTAHIASQSDTEVVLVAGSCPGSCPGPGSVDLFSDTGSRVALEEGWKYGRIDSVFPASGQVGTLTTITGQGLQLDGERVTNVQLAGVDVESIVFQNDSYVVVVAAEALASSMASVTVISNSGQSVSKPLQWSYLQSSTISSVTPSAGQYGTRVLIQGARLYGGGSTITQVWLAGYLAEIVNISNTSISVIASQGNATTGDVVLISDTNARTVASNGWSQLEPSVITNVTAPEGRVGTRVLIEGRHLLGGGSHIVSVTLVGVEVAMIVSDSDTQVEVISASNTPGRGDVVLTSNTGATVRKVNAFSFVDEGGVSSVVPDNGQYGTVVGIFGENFHGGGATVVAVTLAGVPATVLNESNVAVYVRANASVAANGDVVLIADTGATLTLENGWTYNEPGVIYQLSPNFGQFKTQVMLYGQRLGGGGTIQRVTLAGVPAILFAANDSVVELAAGPGNAGLGDVVIVSNTGSTVILSEGFTYLDEPSVVSIDPNEGQTGTEVRICGTSMLGGGTTFQSVHLGISEATILYQNTTCVIFEV